MLKFLKKEANMTYTENGAATYRSTQSECLDLFATIGALRRESDEEITNRFLRAYAEDSDLAMKTLFFARDIRGGIGERRVFRTILKWLAANEPQSLEKNIQYIAEYGRYDDLLALMSTTCEGKALQQIKKQLTADCAALEAGDSISLLAKWLPSVNASNDDTVRQAKRIARAMGMNDAQYRKTLSALRAKIGIIENNLRKKDYTFDYSKQPSKAMFKYRKAFMRNDGERYGNFMNRVAEGVEQIHTGGLTPYEMIKPFFNRGSISDAERTAIDATWKAQEDFTGEENALVVIDGSGSMYGGADPIPATVALSLGIYYAERNTGAFQNLDKHFSNFFLQNGMDVILCYFIGSKPGIHPVCMLFDLRIAADILLFKDILFQKRHFLFQPRRQNSQSHYFDQADVFLLYMVKVCRRMIYTPRALIRCNIVSKYQIQFIQISMHSCDRSNRIVRCSVCFTKNESFLIGISAPCSKDMICCQSNPFCIGSS